MIYPFKSLCKVAENFSFLKIDFNALSVSLKAVFAMEIPFLKPY